MQDRPAFLITRQAHLNCAVPPIHFFLPFLALPFDTIWMPLFARNAAIARRMASPAGIPSRSWSYLHQRDCDERMRRQCAFGIDVDEFPVALIVSSTQRLLLETGSSSMAVCR